jgi:hypothetical protein
VTGKPDLHGDLGLRQMKAIDRSRSRGGQARRLVEGVICDEESAPARPLTNAAIRALADVHEHWLYERADVKAHANRVRAQIRQVEITAAAASQTELAEQLTTDNGQLLAKSGRRPMPKTSSIARVRFSKVWTLRLLLDLVAQKYHAVFEQGGLDRLQVLAILENAGSLAA